MNSTFKNKLKNKEFIRCIEVLPPKDSNITPIIEDLKKIQNQFDVLSIVDNPRGIVHMSSLACSYLIQKMDFETIMHVSCTNKNRIEIQSQILGAVALEIKNLLFVTGDHVLSGENQDARPVYDIDSIQAIRIAKNLNNNLNNNLFIGAVANQLSGELQIKGIEKKVEAGAEFIMTQPVFDIKKFKEFIEKLKDKDKDKDKNISLYLIAGLMPLKSIKHAEFINNKIPGIQIPPEVIERLKNSKNPYQEGINIANETIEDVKEIKEISGINVMGMLDLKTINKLEI